ncbi:MAG: amino acid permease, partial [Pirellulales bacterium]
MPDSDPLPAPLDDEQRQRETIADDVRLLNSLGYGQELSRQMSGFSNFAVSFSIICIVAGGMTSFPQGLSSVGGAAIGIGWPVSCLLALCVALAMAQIASAFPTAGGLYHWAAILGGRGWGWLTAWFNLAGLVTVLAAINVGTYLFAARSVESAWGVSAAQLGPGGELALQIAGVTAITVAQAIFNHIGIRVTAALTDFSGYWIMFIALALTGAMLIAAPSLDPARLLTFTNYSGAAGGDIWPATQSIGWLFLLGFLLPAYTITGFDASAHTSEETVGASHHVPRGNVRSVFESRDKNTSPGMFQSDKPVYASADFLEVETGNGIATYRQKAKLWQEDQVIRASVLVLDRNAKRLVAETQVVSLFYLEQESAEKKKERKPATVQAE